MKWTQGKKLPDKIRKFIIEAKKNAPKLTYQQIVDKVLAEFQYKIDKSTVGRVLKPALFSQPREDTEKAIEAGDQTVLRIENDREAVLDITAEYGRKKSSEETRTRLQDFIGEWEMEITLRLNYLDSTDLSMEKGGVPRDDSFGTGITIPWERTSRGDIIRRFRVEDRDEFKIIYKNLGKLRIPFRDCQSIGGRIIKACSELGADIRKQSESKTKLKMIAKNPAGPEEPRLNMHFAWTIYADSLAIFGTKFEKNEYYFQQTGPELGQVRWGDYCTLSLRRV